MRRSAPVTVDEATEVPWLQDAAAGDRDLAGSKAANLAVAARHGLPVVEGFVVPVPVVEGSPQEPTDAVVEAWSRLSGGGLDPVVVRSSAPGEDLAASSMAGVFDSVLDVRGGAAFVEAYRRVVASAHGEPMAVLVQRHLAPELGGVLFGCDPVTGRADRTVVVAVVGGPHRLVGGEVAGRRVELDRAARVRACDGDPAPVLSPSDRRHLLALARRTRSVFGGPQDVEWAIDHGRVVLLQSRPVTAVGAVGSGPLLGPGPMAETFPQPLTRLEQDLWVPPLRDATAHVLALTGAASRRRRRRSPVVAVVDDQVVTDLDLVGEGERRTGLAALDPRPSMRRLGVAWRTGRLRAAIAALCDALLLEVDAALAAVPDPAELSDEQLRRVLANAGAYLRSAHGHEMLAGALLPEEVGRTGAAAAIEAIATGRALGWGDDDIVARLPVALAVTAPALGPRPPLPEVVATDGGPGGPLPRREELRIRVRWLHELTRAVVVDVGHRLAVRGLLDDPAHVAHLSLEQLLAALDGVRPQVAVPAGGRPVPVPARFRLAADGSVVSEEAGGGAGVGAGGGRGTGPVAFEHPERGDVLVVRTLDPALAPFLPRLAGLVAETGSPLSHLAILAREHGVPVVVGDAGARSRLRPGTVVVVDGRSGAVEVVDVAEAGR